MTEATMTQDQREVITRAVLYGLKEFIDKDTPNDAIKARAEALAEAMVSAVAVINKVPVAESGPGVKGAAVDAGLIHPVKG